MHACGPTPQLTPIASTPAATRARTAMLGRRAVGEHEVLAEGHRRDHRHVRRPARLVDGEQQVRQVEEGLDDEQVDAALEQAVDLLPEGGADDGLVGVAQLARRRPQRPDAPADAGVAAAHVAGLAGDLRGPPVEAPGLRREAERVEAQPVGPERERLDQLRTGIEVLAVHRPDEVRAGRGELVEARALGDAAREQQRAHAAVREQRACGEARGEPFARGSLAGHRAEA